MKLYVVQPMRAAKKTAPEVDLVEVARHHEAADQVSCAYRLDNSMLSC